MAVRVHIAVSVACAGCLSKPPAPALGDASASALDGSGSDATGDGAMGGLCTIDDEFDAAAMPCGTWGTVLGLSPVRVSGRLETTPSSIESGCETQELAGTGAFSIQLDQLGFGSDGNYVFFDLLWGGANQVTLNIYHSAGSDDLGISCPGSLSPSVMYDANAHRYLRYKMTPAGADVAVEIGASSDGLSFPPLATCTLIGVSASLPIIRFATAIDQVDATPPTSAWDSLHYDCTL
jgi:hypothetical protein